MARVAFARATTPFDLLNPMLELLGPVAVGSLPGTCRRATKADPRSAAT
jgi:hypothetical protein